jgi:hypothetical protein
VGIGRVNVAQTLLSVLLMLGTRVKSTRHRFLHKLEEADRPNYSKYLRRKFAELKFCAIMPA